ncbi:MAG: hypothetical protein QM723_05260 [Myxococcaceae bacterium]
MPRKPPPAAHRFKKGQSGNAGGRGRSKEAKLFILRAREFMSEKGFAALEKAVGKGGANGIRALQLLAVYGIGKPLEAGQVAALEQALAAKGSSSELGRLAPEELEIFGRLLKKTTTPQPNEHSHQLGDGSIYVCVCEPCGLRRVEGRPQLPAGDVVDAELKS